MTSTIDIGISALQAHTRAMEVTSHNIANAATPGFSRQRADLATLDPESTRPGQLGRGVQVEGIIRLQDNLLVERLRNVQSDVGRYETLAKVLVDSELVFNEPGADGFSAVMDNLFAAFEDLSNSPELSSLRAGTVQNLRTFSGVLNGVGERLRVQSEGLFQAMEDEVVQVNNLLDRIADLNQDISRETALQRNANDLMDQRERLLKELSTHVQASVRVDPGRNMANVSIAGRLVVGGVNASHLAVERLDGGKPFVVVAESREIVEVTRGNLGAYAEMGQEILPAYRERLDEMALRMMAAFNQAHTTGTSHLAQSNSFLSDQVIDSALTATDLDDVAHAQADGSPVGVPALLLPDFTDASGNVTSANLTINVLDRLTGTAEKFIVRYDPGSSVAPAGRSLENLVEAINTGRGGGFTVYPTDATGAGEVRARLASVDGGVRLELTTDENHSIDFSPSLDLRPADGAWTGDSIQVAGSEASLAGQRLFLEVDGTDLDAYTLDPVTGNQTALGSVAIGGLPVNIGATGLTVSLPGGSSLVDGERFAIDFDASGAMTSGATYTQAAAWRSGDAGFRVDGRYTGGHSFDPARPWQVRVVQGGTIGSANNAPIIEVTSYNGPDDARTQQVRSFVLDDDLPPGSQIPLDDGVYLVFDAGDLSTGGTGVDVIVDGQPDQAGLLPALGLNTLFTGSSAETLQVSKAIRDEPDRLAVARTRSPGDNSNVLELAAVRQQLLFNDGQVDVDDYYQSLVSDIGVRVQQAEGLQENQAIIAESLENRRDAVSGVNIDEQVGQLILQQQAYTAAARIISISRENIQTLLELFG